MLIPTGIHYNETGEIEMSRREQEEFKQEVLKNIIAAESKRSKLEGLSIANQPQIQRKMSELYLLLLAETSNTQTISKNPDLERSLLFMLSKHNCIKPFLYGDAEEMKLFCEKYS